MDLYHSIVWPMVSYHWKPLKNIRCDGCWTKNHCKTIGTNSWWSNWKTIVTIPSYDQWFNLIANSYQWFNLIANSYHNFYLKNHRIHGRKPLTIPPCLEIDYCYGLERLAPDVFFFCSEFVQCLTKFFPLFQLLSMETE